MKNKFDRHVIELIFVSQLFTDSIVLKGLNPFLELFYKELYKHPESVKIRKEIEILNELLDARETRSFDNIPSMTSILNANRDISLFITEEIKLEKEWILTYENIIRLFNIYSEFVNKIVNININIFSSYIGIDFKIPGKITSYRQKIYKEISKSFIDTLITIDSLDKDVSSTEIQHYIETIFDKSDKLKVIKEECLKQVNIPKEKLFNKDFARMLISGVVSGGIILSAQYFLQK